MHRAVDLYNLISGASKRRKVLVTPYFYSGATLKE